MLFGKFELTDEMVARAKKTESAEELMKLAQEYEISLTEDDARQIQLFLSGGELSDDDLTAVAG